MMEAVLIPRRSRRKQLKRNDNEEQAERMTDKISLIFYFNLAFLRLKRLRMFLVEA